MPFLASPDIDASSGDPAATIGGPALVSGPGLDTPAGAPLVFTFNEPIRIGSGTLAITGPAGVVYRGEIGATPGLTVTGSTLVITAYPALAYGTIHTVSFGAGAVLDLDGNALGGGEAIDYPFIAALSPVALTIAGTPGDDRLLGSELADVIDGGDGNDSIYGYGGNDTLRGGAGNDDVNGGDGNDVIDGGAGDDWLSGDDGDDRIDGGAGNDRIFSGAGMDELRGGAGNDTLDDSGGGADMMGEDGNDTLLVSRGMLPLEPQGRYRLYGGNGNDTLVLSAGTGLLDGGDDDDFLSIRSYASGVTGLIDAHGGAGDDHLSVELFNSPKTIALTGGAGSDLFSIDGDAGDGSITIRDFATGAGGDVLDVFDALPNGVAAPFAGGYLRFQQRGADTVVQIDLDGAGSAHGFADLVTLSNVARDTLAAANIRYGHLPGEVVTPGQRRDGTDGPDRLEGGAGADHLAGGAGADVLAGGGGNDVLDGGAGLDTALYTGARADYEIYFDGGRQVDDKRGGAQDGRDTLTGVERLVFSDGALALDTGNSDVAAQAYRLYRAAFDRTPDEGGLGFWISRLDAGVELSAMASEFVRSAEFLDLYGAAPANAAVLRQLYLNVFDREPDAGGFDFWLTALDSGRASLATVLLEFSASPENIGATAALIAEGIPYQPYLG